MITQQRESLWLPIFLYGLLAFVLSFFLLPPNNFIGYDGVYYARMAENVMAGRGITAGFEVPYAHPPLYPILMGILSKLFFHDTEFSGHFISILAFSFTIIPVFLLARTVYSVSTAHWTSFLYATHGFLLINSNLVMTETLFTLLVMSQIYLVHHATQEEANRISPGIFIGIIGGLAYLTRPEGLFVSVVAILSLFLLSPKPFVPKTRLILVSLTAFLVFFLPYVSFVHHKAHKMPLSGAMTELLVMKRMHTSSAEQYLEAKKIYEGLTSDKTRPKVEELDEQFDFFDYLRANHFALLRQVFPSVIVRIMGINQYLFGGVGFLLIGASFFSAPWDQRRRRAELLFLLFLSTFLPVLFGIFIPKRFLTYFPIFLIWMGNGIEVLRSWAKGSFNLNQRKSFIVASGVCLLFCLPSAWYLHRTFTQFPMPFENKELGLWMKENIPHIEEEKVAARHRSVNYYAGAEIIKLPYVEKFGDFLTYMAHQRARYFAVSEDLDQPILDSYRFLLDETKALPLGINRVHTVKGNHKIILYEIIS